MQERISQEFMHHDNNQTAYSYLATPKRCKGPSVLVLHPQRRLNDTIRAACMQLAEASFVAFAPNLYHGEEALKHAGRPVTFYRYSGTGHWFFEPDRSDAYRQAAASLA